MTHSAAIASATHQQIATHLLQHRHDEDVCFALYRPSRGSERFSGLVQQPVLPRPGDRTVHGNASISSEYFSRVLEIAQAEEAGLVFLHSHTQRSRGWQGMSRDDVDTEQLYAPRAQAVTGLPLLGMTLAGDQAWSARFWTQTRPGRFERTWCENVRVVGDAPLSVTYHDEQRPPPRFREELKRTISAWGPKTQSDLVRLRVGVIGAGSVGSIVAEALARGGFEHIRLIDFDTVKRHNLDRLLHASPRDVRLARSKVESLQRGLRRSATAEHPRIDALEHSLVEEAGFEAALDCDVLFSCVDRPWPRLALNLIAYAHLIPVVDGGIRISVRDEQLQSADWKAHMAAPGRRCLQCLGQYQPELVALEQAGDLDDPSYLDSLPDDHPLKANENVFAFSLGAASLEMLELLRSVVAPAGLPDVGSQHYSFKTGQIDLDTSTCNSTCRFSGPLLASGDGAAISVTARHAIAENERRERQAAQQARSVRVGRALETFSDRILSRIID
jgi:hypothetical protein